MSIKITGLQQVQDALEKELKKLATSEYALVGIHESAGMHEGSELTQAAVGAYNHFGTPDIEARPFLDVGVAQGTKEYLDVIQEGIEKGLTSKQILDQVGVEAVGFVQQYITDLRTPKNKESTIKRKGSDNPLIDTGSMRQSITYTVTSKKPEHGI